MELLNAIELDRASRKHPQVAEWLRNWRTIVLASDWRSLLDVRKAYPSADGVPIGKGRATLIVTVFNAGGNDDRLLTRIDYSRRLVRVEEVLTHAEYAKEKWKKKYE